jgi:hypothetical protein
MKKLFEVRLGGGRVQSGLLPVEALKLIRGLMAAMEEEGGDHEAWKRANPHIQIVGEASTRAAILTEEYPQLLGPTQVFVHKAMQRNLGPKGLDLVEKEFRPDQVWEFAELTVCSSTRPMVRFDAPYREAVNEERSPVHSVGDVYARVIRVGGERPTTAKLEIGKQSGTYEVNGRDLAKKLANRLFETVKIRAAIAFDRKTLEIASLTVLGIDETWTDVHLGQVIETYGGKLPVRLSVANTEDILRERQREREEL